MKKILAVSFVISHLLIYSQSVVQKTEYFDWRKTKISHTWFELGDGMKHGSEKYYFENSYKDSIDKAWLNWFHVERKIIFPCKLIKLKCQTEKLR